MKNRIRTSREVLELVKRYVERSQPEDFKLIVSPDGVMHVTEGADEGDDRWYVAVRYEPEVPEVMSRYSDLTLEIEEKIQKKEKLNVFLMSMLPMY